MISQRSEGKLLREMKCLEQLTANKMIVFEGCSGTEICGGDVGELRMHY